MSEVLGKLNRTIQAQGPDQLWVEARDALAAAYQTISDLHLTHAAALAAERDRADRAEARIAEAAALLPRDPYDTRDIGPGYTVEGVDEAFEILNATEATA